MTVLRKDKDAQNYAEQTFIINLVNKSMNLREKNNTLYQSIVYTHIMGHNYLQLYREPESQEIFVLLSTEGDKSLFKERNHQLM